MERFAPPYPPLREPHPENAVEETDPRSLGAVLERLEQIAANVREHGGVNVEPMQLAALLLEKTTEDLSESEAEKLVRPKQLASR